MGVLLEIACTGFTLPDCHNSTGLTRTELVVA